MTVSDEEGVRINIIVEREVNDRLNKLLPRGHKSNVLADIVRDMVEQLEDDSDGAFMLALMRGNVELSIK